MTDQAPDREGRLPSTPFERRSVLEATPASPGATSPWRWILVAVPLVVILCAASLVIGSLSERAARGLGSATMPERAVLPASRPTVADRDARRAGPLPHEADRAPAVPSADLSWIWKDAPARPSSPRSVDQPAPSAAQWAFNAAAVVTRLATADHRNGSAIFRTCVVCHSAERGAAHRLGPRLWGIIGRPKASYEDFRYSQALRAQGGRWTYEEVARYLYDTRSAVPGGAMAFAGIRDPDRLADVIAFMRTLAEKPEPLP